MYLTNDLMNWAVLNDICILRVMDIHWSYQNLLFGLPLSGIGSKPIRLSDVLNLKNLKTIWGIKLIFASIKGTKNVILFWVMLDNILGQSVYRIFFFWLVWIFNLNIGDPLLRCNCFLACLKISRKVFKHFWRISIACATVPPQLYFFKVLYHDPVQ